MFIANLNNHFNNTLPLSYIPFFGNLSIIAIRLRISFIKFC